MIKKNIIILIAFTFFVMSIGQNANHWSIKYGFKKRRTKIGGSPFAWGSSAFYTKTWTGKCGFATGCDF